MKSRLILHSLVATIALAASGCSGGGRTNPALVPNQDANRSAASVQTSGADVLYVGDASDNTVKRFDATSGTYLPPKPFITQTGSGRPLPINGPRGLLSVRNLQEEAGTASRVHQRTLLLVNQNVGSTQPGAIESYNGITGDFLGDLVPSTNPDAPFAPRGIVLANALFVASLQGVAVRSDGQISNGKVQAYTRKGQLIADLQNPFPPIFPQNLQLFHPRGVVIGPDGLLYVSNDPVLGGTGGQVLRYHTDGPRFGFKDVYITTDKPSDKPSPPLDFNRPEGLVFGPDGNLYVTSFAVLDASHNPITTDKILIFAGPGSSNPGAFVGKIDLDTVSQPPLPRAYAQALLFGPGGLLYVPITSTGEVRLYNVQNSPPSFRDLVQPGGPLQQPYYLTFGNTDPATLNYCAGRDERLGESCGD